MEINGIAHIQLTVSRWDAALAFYEKLLPFLGLTEVMRFEGFYYCVGGRTGVAISLADGAHPRWSSSPTTWRRSCPASLTC